VQGEGKVVILGTQTSITSLDVYEQGIVYTEQMSVARITSNLTLHSGSLSGNGELWVEASAVLYLHPITLQAAFIDTVTIINHGTIDASNTSITWYKGAQLYNYGEVVFDGNQTWKHGDPEMYFDIYSKLLGCDPKLLSVVGELCDKPNLHKETLEITLKNLEKEGLSLNSQ
jgi:hypothetical protein